MSDDAAPVLLMCSGCRTPTPIEDARALPRWSPDAQRVWTAYRCRNCVAGAIAELRAALGSGAAEIVASFYEFLERSGFNDIDTLRALPATEQATSLSRIVDAIDDGRIRFDP